MPRTVVACLASGVPAVNADIRPFVQPYFVMLGTIESRRNHWFLLYARRHMAEESGERAPVSVVIGRRRWGCENVTDMLEHCMALRGKVIEEANRSDQCLYSYLRHAQAPLFPPFVEDYGMPLVGASSMRVPMIASDLSIFQEIVGEIPNCPDPLDGPGQMARILGHSTTNSMQHANQLTCTEGSRESIWQQHLEVVNQFIEELV